MQEHGSGMCIEDECCAIEEKASGPAVLILVNRVDIKLAIDCWNVFAVMIKD